MPEVKLQSKEEDAWLKQQAFLVVHCHLTMSEARAVDDRTFKYFYDTWLERVQLEERLTARLCAVVANFASAFGGARKKFSEEDFIALKATQDEALSPEASRAFLTTPKHA